MTRRLEDWARGSAERKPEAIAVVDGSGSVTYGELVERADAWCRRLVALGTRPGDRVALALPKSADAVVAMHAVLAAGAAYVPLDAESPPARIEKVLASCRPRVILAGGAVRPGLAESLARSVGSGHGARLGWMDRGRAAPGALAPAVSADDTSAGGDAPAPAARESRIAHILFTSGSTGTPKGVVITHANVLAFVDWANGYFRAGPDDRNSGHSPFFFDLSTWDIYGTLASGGELHLVPPSLNLIAPRLAELIRERRLTRWFSVPSVLAYMASFDAVRDGDFPELRELTWCGEVFPTPALRYWMRRLPHVRFTNLYGPTEATIASSVHTVASAPESDHDEVPIGVACDGEALHVLDGKLAPRPTGEVGELYISGAGLAEGYWDDPAKTAEAFVEAPDGTRIYRTGDLALLDGSGLVRFRGRADRQIKSRGYRIELGEIEAALGALPGLAESAVVAIETGGFEGYRICGAVVPREGGRIEPRELAEALRGLVPAYMVPAEWRVLTRLPRTGNNKIDRKAIAAEFSGPVAPDGPGEPGA